MAIQRRRPKKAGDGEVIGRSRGGMSTKVHALVDALGNPVCLHLAGGPARDLLDADHLPTFVQAGTLIADRAHDVGERVLIPPAAAVGTAVIPPKANRRSPCRYDRHLHKERHLVENFFAKLRQSRIIPTSYDKAATLGSTSACSLSSIVRRRASGHASGTIWLDAISFQARRGGAAVRLGGTGLLEQNDEWDVRRARDIGLETIALL